MPTAASPQYDVIVVGSGPGGATVARDLSLAGKRVLLIERGLDYRTRFYYGTYLGALIYADRRSLLFTQEGLNIIRPLMVGASFSRRRSRWRAVYRPAKPAPRMSTFWTDLSSIRYRIATMIRLGLWFGSNGAPVISP